MVSRQAISSMKRRKQMMYLYTLFLLIFATAFALLSLVGVLESTRVVICFSGAAFWLGLIGTICMAFRINHCRKNCSQFNKQFPELKQLGLIHFFQNKAAFIADIAMFVSIIGFIIFRIFVDGVFALFILFAVFIFSFGMHCMLNGISYKYINYKIRREI